MPSIIITLEEASDVQNAQNLNKSAQSCKDRVTPRREPLSRDTHEITSPCIRVRRLDRLPDRARCHRF